MALNHQKDRSLLESNSSVWWVSARNVNRTYSEKETYYIFDWSGWVNYEQKNNVDYQYIYVGGKHFARVDTNRMTEESRTYFYHTDYLSSTVLVTDEKMSGLLTIHHLAVLVWQKEYWRRQLSLQVRT